MLSLVFNLCFHESHSACVVRAWCLRVVAPMQITDADYRGLPEGCPGMSDLLRTRSFGRLLRSISLNRNDYSPLSIVIAEPISDALAKTLVLEQTPGQTSYFMRRQ